MIQYTEGFAHETAVTVIIRLIFIGFLLAGGIWVIKYGFNSKADDNF